MENAVYGRVYLVRNLINGKVYIGQTTMKLATRWGRHKCDAKRSNNYFARAIMKHGADNFEVVELCICLDRQTLNLAEKGFIEVFDSMNPEFGYNIREGGSKGAMPKEFYQGLSARFSGENHWNFGGKMKAEHKARLMEANLGRKLTDEHRQKISKAQIGKPKKKWGEGARLRASQRQKGLYSGNKNPFFGKAHTEETKARISAMQNRASVEQIGIEGEVLATFKSIMEASLQTGISKGCISLCTKGKRKTSGGFGWRLLK
jgi:group I intron endonuclease